MGVSSFNAVPYALYAEKSTSEVSVSSYGDTLTINDKSIILPGISFANYDSLVVDGSGNSYRYLDYGDAGIWMIEDLGASHYNDGTPIPSNYVVHNWDSSIRATYSAAVFIENNICPIGWHVPSRSEWHTLISKYANIVYTQSDFCNNTLDPIYAEFDSPKKLLTYDWPADDGVGYNTSNFQIDYLSNYGQYMKYYTSDITPSSCYTDYTINNTRLLCILMKILLILNKIQIINLLDVKKTNQRVGISSSFNSPTSNS